MRAFKSGCHAKGSSKLEENVKAWILTVDPELLLLAVSDATLPLESWNSNQRYQGYQAQAKTQLLIDSNRLRLATQTDLEWWLGGLDLLPFGEFDSSPLLMGRHVAPCTHTPHTPQIITVSHWILLILPSQQVRRCKSLSFQRLHGIRLSRSGKSFPFLTSLRELKLDVEIY